MSRAKKKVREVRRHPAAMAARRAGVTRNGPDLGATVARVHGAEVTATGPTYEHVGARRPRKNAYYCEDCRGYVVTIDVDEGVTPMFLACRVKGDPTDPANDCKGTSRSMMYPAEPWPETDGFGQPIPTEPTWEWFKPASLAGLSEGMRDHVARGGLHLRKRSS